MGAFSDIYSGFRSEAPRGRLMLSSKPKMTAGGSGTGGFQAPKFPTGSTGTGGASGAGGSSVSAPTMQGPAQAQLPTQVSGLGAAMAQRAQQTANQAGTTAAGGALAAGGFGSSRGAAVGAGNMQAQAAAQGALAGDQIQQRDLDRQGQFSLANAGFQQQSGMQGNELGMQRYLTETGRDFQAQQANLDRMMQQAIQTGNWSMQQYLAQMQDKLSRDQMANQNKFQGLGMGATVPDGDPYGLKDYLFRIGGLG